MKIATKNRETMVNYRRFFWIYLFFLFTWFLGISGESNAAEEKRLLLVTGCARSGTAYIAKVLTRAGLQFGHESMRRDGLSCWTMTVESNWSPWGPLRKNIKFAHIFHQIRDPLKTISSVYSREPPVSWKYIMEHVPEIHEDDSRLVKSAKYWYYWNLKAAKIAEWSYRIEDLPEVWEELQERLAINLDGTGLKEVPTNTNTCGNYTRKVTWEDLKKELTPAFYGQVRKLAASYKYL